MSGASQTNLLTLPFCHTYREAVCLDLGLTIGAQLRYEAESLDSIHVNVLSSYMLQDFLALNYSSRPKGVAEIGPTGRVQ